MNKINLTFTILFGIGIASPLVALPFLSSTYATVDETENRTLNPFPSKITDHVGEDFTAFFDDHFPFRQSIVKTYNNLLQVLSDFYIGLFKPKTSPVSSSSGSNESSGEDSSLSDISSSDIITSDPEESTLESSEVTSNEYNLKYPIDDDYADNAETYATPEDDYGAPYKQVGDVIYGRNDFLFYAGEDELLDYTKTNIPTEDELETYASQFKKVSDYFTKQGKKVMFMVCPNKSNVYSDYMPSSISRMEEENNKAETIVNYLNDNLDNLTSIYPINDLNAVKPKRTLYYKTDTHWNAMGGFVGFRAFMDQLDTHYAIPYSVKEDTTEGDLAKIVGETCSDDVNYLVGFKNDVSVTSTSTDMGNGYSLVNYACPDAALKDAVFIHDSFGYGMWNYFSKEFEHSSFVNLNSDFTQIFATDTYENSEYVVIEMVERSLYRLFLDTDDGILQQIINYFDLEH